MVEKKVKKMEDIIDNSIKDEIGRPTAFGYVRDRPIKLEIGKTDDKKYFVSSTILSEEGLTGRKVMFKQFNDIDPTRSYFLNLVNKHNLKRVNELEIHKHLYEKPQMSFLDSTGYYSRLSTDMGRPPRIKDLKGLEKVLQNLDDEYTIKKISLPKGEYLIGISSKSDTYFLNDVSYFDDEDFFDEFWSKISKYTEPFEFYHSSKRFDILNCSEIDGQQLIHTLCNNGNVDSEMIEIFFDRKGRIIEEDNEEDNEEE